MKIGIIGPSQIVAKANRVIKNEFPQIEPVNYVYSIYLETLALLQYHHLEVDALLFTGKTPYTLACKSIPSSVPWEYVPRSGSSMLRVLLSAKLWTDYDICNVSIDTYDQALLHECYQEIGLPIDQLKIFISKEDLISQNYHERVCEFHTFNYIQNRVSCCITGLQRVYDELRTQSIPCLLIEPTTNIIRETLLKLQLKYLVKVNQQSQLAAVSIQIDSPSEYSLLADNEYSIALNRMKVSEQVYLFAQRIQAAVMETGDTNYLLFTTTQLLENETDNLKAIELLNAVKLNTSCTVSIGIGYGKTASEVKNGALLGMQHASKKGGSLAFIVFNGKQIIGPMDSVRHTKDASPPMIDERFLRISDKVGVSINTVYKLQCIVDHFGKTTFTTKELAPLFGVTTRTMNRLIDKFESQGYAKMIGKRIIGNSGRPSRIIQLMLE